MIKNNIQWALKDPKTNKISIIELYQSRAIAKEGQTFWGLKDFKIIKVKVTEVK